MHGEEGLNPGYHRDRTKFKKNLIEVASPNQYSISELPSSILLRIMWISLIYG